MNVNRVMAEYSDWLYFSAFALYFLAFLISVAYYSRQSSRFQIEDSGMSNGDSKNLSGKADVGTLQIKPDKLGFAEGKTGRKLGLVMDAFLSVGVSLHLASVILRGLSTQRFPWANLYEYISLTLLFTMLSGMILLRKKSIRSVWPWFLAPVLVLMFYGGKNLYVDAGPVVPALQSIWIPIHVTIISLGCGIALISGATSFLFLIKYSGVRFSSSKLLKALTFPLPPLNQLDAVAYRSAIWAFPIFGIGIIFGAIWADSAWGRYWGWDPKETMSFITWSIYALYLHARATSGWRSVKAAAINVLGFGTMIFNLFFINMVVSGLHSYAGLN